MEGTLNVEHGDHDAFDFFRALLLSFTLALGGYMAAHYNCHFPTIL